MTETTVANNAIRLPIYMDYLATTPIDPRVLDTMLPYLKQVYGNAASRNHSFGWAAEAAVDKAREQIARLIHCSPKELIFTSGATESDNLAIKGVCEMYRERGNHIVTQVTEHKAVLDTCKRMEKIGYRVTYLPVQADGLVAVKDVADAITDETILVTVMTANNEIGTLNPVAEIGALCKQKGVIFHTDASQAIGKVAFDVEEVKADIVSLSAHKLYGPKGIGALYVRRRNPRVQLTEQINGGGHERGMRSGTLNVPGIVALGAACEISMNEMGNERLRLKSMKDRLHHRLVSGLDFVQSNGNPDHQLPGVLNISFLYVEGESLLMGINDVAVSSGSACTSATLEPSYVLKALGLGDEVAHSSIRFGMGRFNTTEEVDYVADRVIEVVKKLRELSPLYEMVKSGIDLASVEWAAH